MENPMDRGDWQATVHGVTTTEKRTLSTHSQTLTKHLLRATYRFSRNPPHTEFSAGPLAPKKVEQNNQSYFHPGTAW